jgi:hypothetical protein
MRGPVTSAADLSRRVQTLLVADLAVAGGRPVRPVRVGRVRVAVVDASAGYRQRLRLSSTGRTRHEPPASECLAEILRALDRRRGYHVRAVEEMPRRRDARVANDSRAGELGDEGQRAGENGEGSAHGVVALYDKGWVDVGMGKVGSDRW